MDKNRKKMLKLIGIRKPEKKITRDDWFQISRTHSLSEEFIREFQEKLFWSAVCSRSVLTENFIREFENKIDWLSISYGQKLSEIFIREYKDRLNWCEISKKQKLSNHFIIEFKDKIHWKQYFSQQEAPFEIMKRFILLTRYNNMDDFETNHLNTLEKEEIEKIIKLRTIFKI